MKIIQEIQRDGAYVVTVITPCGAKMVACGSSREEALERAMQTEPEPA